jgi:ABC-type amino acid transport substrate-binding protein
LTCYIDGIYGSKLDNGTWNGVVGTILEGKYDMAAVDLIISSAREAVIEFSQPYLPVGYLILGRKYTETYTDVWFFTSPYLPELWVAILTTIVIAGFSLYLIDRISPFGRYNRGEPEKKHDMNLPKSLWWSYATFAQIGADNSPGSCSGHIIIIGYCTCTIVFISIYTANLAAFMTVQRLNTPINSIGDLENSGKTVAVLDNSAQMAYLQSDTRLAPPFLRPFSTKYGALAAVKNGEVDYYVDDQPILEYMASENCDVQTIGNPFSKTGFGFAYQKESPYREFFMRNLAYYQETGFYDNLYNKWITSGSCDNNDNIPTSRLGFSSMAGVFYLLVGVLVLAIVVLLIEILVSKVHIAHHIPKNVRKLVRDIILHQTTEEDSPETDDYHLLHV